MMRPWLRGASVSAVIAAVAVVLGARPAGADTDTVSSSAVGVSVTSIAVPTSPIGAPMPGAVSGTASGPAPGFGPLDRSTHLLSLPGVATAGDTEVSASGALTPGARPYRLATAAASLRALSVGGGLLAAARLSSTCVSSMDGSSGSTLLEGVTLGGMPVPASPPPNSVIVVPGVLRAVLNEQVVAGLPLAGSIVVRAVHLQFLAGEHPAPALDVVLAEARCATSGPVRPGSGPPPGLGQGPGQAPPAAASLPPPGGAATSPHPGQAPPAASPAPPPVEMPVRPGLGAPAPATGPSLSPPGSGRGVQKTSLAIMPQAGPPGTEIRVVASGFGSCPEVAVVLDAARIGSARPDPAGAIDRAGLTVPGDTAPGRHHLSASCLPSGRSAAQPASFDVTRAAVHRSAFATSVPEPGEVPTSLTALLTSALTAAALLLLIVFPSELFNSTLDENYDEVRGWFGLEPKVPKETRSLTQGLAFAGFILLGGVLYGLLSPDFGLNRSSLALALGLSASLALISVMFRLPFLLHVRQRHGQRVRFRVLPGTALVAAACVALSRAVHFEPGYLYGLIAGLEFGEEPTETTGRLTSAAALSILAVGLLAWVARAPIAAAAGHGGGFWPVAAEACLAAIFVVSLETAVFALVPLRFLEGAKVTAWSRAVWTAIFGLALLAFVHILLQPTSGYVASSADASRTTAIALFVGFGLFSIGFWAYFRFRPARFRPRVPPPDAPGPRRAMTT